MDGELELGSRYDLKRDLEPDAPEVLPENHAGETGYLHSYEAGVTVDGPGVRLTIFTSGCLLRCLYCHNPDTWHLKDGRRVHIDRVIERLRPYVDALKAMHGGVTISGGEPMVQKAFVGRIFRACKEFGLHTALDTSGYLGAKADDEFLEDVDLVLLDIKSSIPDLYRRLTNVELAPTLVFAERLARLGKPVWVRFVLVPGLTDEVENVEGIARFLAPMRNVEFVEVLPFHQLGAFKYKTLSVDYTLDDVKPPSPELMARVLGQFRDRGLNAR
jgi:pyruvate formate lyase activating enzyme